MGAPVYEAITPARPSVAALGALAGDYFGPELRSTYRLALERGALVLHAKNLPATPLEPTIPDEFLYPSEGLTLHFTRRDARVTGFLLSSGRTQGIRFDRRAPAAAR
jgi:hypothetical protein